MMNYHVFVTTPAKDLKSHTSAWLQHLDSAGFTPVTYQSEPYRDSWLSVSEQVRACDLVVVCIPSSYCSVGDDTKSTVSHLDEKNLTQWQVEAALQFGIPVLAFFIDELVEENIVSMPLTGDGDVEELGESRKHAVLKQLLYKQAAQVTHVSNVQSVPSMMTTVLTTWFDKLNQRLTAQHSFSANRRRYLISQSLPRADHLLERESLLDDLESWLTEEQNSNVLVRQVLGVKGIGKSALLAELVHRLKSQQVKPLQLFSWSFQDNPCVDDFLMAVCEYLWGKRAHTNSRINGYIELIKNFCTEQAVQLGTHPRVTFLIDSVDHAWQIGGEIDNRLKQFISAISDSQSVYLLFTSEQSIFSHHTLLSDTIQIDVLRVLSPASSSHLLMRNLLGSSAEISPLVETINGIPFNLLLLNGYINIYEHGTVDVKRWHAELSAQSGPGGQARFLIEKHLAAMTDICREFLELLALFPAVASLDEIAEILRVSNSEWPALTGMDDAEIIIAVKSLERVGLLYAYQTVSHPRQVWYRLHSEVRWCLIQRLEQDAQRFSHCHCIISEQIRRMLNAQAILPDSLVPFPSQHQSLSHSHERLVLHLLLSNDVKVAWRTLQQLWAYEQDSHALNYSVSSGIDIYRYPRQGVVCYLLVRLIQSDHIHVLSKEERALIASFIGFTALSLGNFSLAERYFLSSANDIRDSHEKSYVSLLRVIDTLVQKGQFDRVKREILPVMQDCYPTDSVEAFHQDSIVRIVWVAYCLGDVEQAARLHQSISFDIKFKPGVEPAGLLYKARYIIFSGSDAELATLTQDIERWAVDHKCELTKAYGYVLRAWTLRQVSPSRAYYYLRRASFIAQHIGYLDLVMWCHWVEAQLSTSDRHMISRSLHQGLAQARAAELRFWEIELMLQLACLYLRQKNDERCIQLALDAAALASDVQCKYVLGESSAYYYAAKANINMKNFDEAHRLLEKTYSLDKQIKYQRDDIKVLLKRSMRKKPQWLIKTFF